MVPLWVYQDDVRDAIVAAKHASHTALADAIGRVLGDRVAQAIEDEDISPVQAVTYVPSHLYRRWQRGGVGARVIADAVAGKLGKKAHGLIRANRATRKQAWLTDLERIENVRDAYSAKRGYALAKTPRIANQHVLLVDDVLTTGATANEVAKVLRGCGADRVTLAVVARAVRRH
ncbi:MAG: phosphoribosyltransferase family protein [Planctomycetota bacterium]